MGRKATTAEVVQGPGAGFTPEALGAKAATELAQDWLRAKAAEDKCKEWRVAVEAALDALLGHKEEGSQTHTLEDGTKVTTKGVLYRSLDRDAWERVKPRVPEDLRPIKVVEELDERGCKWLAEHRPDVWAVVAEAVTTKPGKVGVKVVPAEGGA